MFSIINIFLKRKNSLRVRNLSSSVANGVVNIVRINACPHTCKHKHIPTYLKVIIKNCPELHS